MLEVARENLGSDLQELRQLTLPDDPLPDADATVAVGHPLNYLPRAFGDETLPVGLHVVTGVRET